MYNKAGININTFFTGLLEVLVVMNKLTKVNLTSFYGIVRNNAKMLLYADKYIMSKYLYMQRR